MGDGGDRPDVLWAPSPDAAAATTMARFVGWLAAERGTAFDTYDELWRWSVEDLGGFWSSIWEFFEVSDRTPTVAVERGSSMADTVWFPGATLNYAERLLRVGGDEAAVVARSQTRGDRQMSRDELRDAVAGCRAGLLRLGVGEGDRVVAYLPNIPEALVAFLATASLGAVWASCPPEFGPRSVLDRFGQLDPVVLFTVGGYRYGAKDVDRSGEVAEIRAGLPTLAHVVEVAYGGPAVPEVVGWDELVSRPAPLSFDDVAFDHPLYVLFSSGTTGLPKAIVHRHGGILLEHLKALGLHQDLGPDDRFFWFTTTGWMMWNYLVSALALGSALVLFDGDPGHPDLGELWRVAGATDTTVLGVSAPFLQACEKAGVRPEALAPGLRSIGSTGAPLPASGYRWVHRHFPDVYLNSISGGTDVCTAFVGGAPTLPVVAGEMSCRLLGAAVEAFGPDGESVVGSEGELVVTAPMPSMPVGFWNDPDGRRFHDAYFAAFPGVWCHGDWLTITERGTCVITGRSDATLNRGGVRLGTSEFYAVVESLPQVADSLIVHLDEEGGAGTLVLLLVLDPPDTPLTAEVATAVRDALRTQLSPRHVPDEIHAVPVVPRTHSGKKLEIPVKRILQGRAVADVASPSSLAVPDALDVVARLAADR
ncbi:MAG: acetoacetate--CoA ligase [Acidimicrobiales bacterium]|jgi:acetoacetyl-CoA synthetase|nr:acetoacetate--CoA ligase [Acidimicrobiales bacterium]